MNRPLPDSWYLPVICPSSACLPGGGIAYSHCVLWDNLRIYLREMKISVCSLWAELQHDTAWVAPALLVPSTVFQDRADSGLFLPSRLRVTASAERELALRMAGLG